MTIDPFSSFAASIEAPYDNAVEITQAQIVAGDIELPAVTSCLRIQCPGPSRLKVTLQSGNIVTLRANGCEEIAVRAVTIHQEIEDDEFLPPDSVIACGDACPSVRLPFAVAVVSWPPGFGASTPLPMIGRGRHAMTRTAHPLRSAAMAASGSRHGKHTFASIPDARIPAAHPRQLSSIRSPRIVAT